MTDSALEPESRSQKFLADNGFHPLPLSGLRRSAGWKISARGNVVVAVEIATPSELAARRFPGTGQTPGESQPIGETALIGSYRRQEPPQPAFEPPFSPFDLPVGTHERLEWVRTHPPELRIPPPHIRSVRETPPPPTIGQFRVFGPIPAEAVDVMRRTFKGRTGMEQAIAYAAYILWSAKIFVERSPTEAYGHVRGSVRLPPPGPPKSFPPASVEAQFENIRAASPVHVYNIAALMAAAGWRRAIPVTSVARSLEEYGWKLGAQIPHLPGHTWIPPPNFAPMKTLEAFG